MPNMLPGRPISGGSVLNGQVQDAEEALALHFRKKIQCLGSHTLTLPVIQASSTCYIFEWNPDGVQLFKGVRSYREGLGIG
jgi:hypothetical protein